MTDQSTYRVILHFQADMEEKTTADDMPIFWDELVLKSKNIDASLVVVKKKFTEVSKYFIDIWF